MTERYEKICAQLREKPATWLITGVAGFIGSNLLEKLLKLGQTVIGMDNISTGYEKNLSEVQSVVNRAQWSGFEYIEGDIRNLVDCQHACKDVDFIMHEAALGSVPGSLEDPINSNDNNISGTLNMFVAARDNKVRRLVYAASSATYGDHPGLPAVEDTIGKPLSPYAVTKYVNELYADVFARCYGLESIGLRYFNVFGPRQDPDGAYAAVIPRWIGELLDGKSPIINGDGDTSRDFCYIETVIQANILAATTNNDVAVNQVYNVAAGDRTTLNDLFYLIRNSLGEYCQNVKTIKPKYGRFRPGDVRHSQADISKASELLDYQPTHTVEEGIKATSEWFYQKAISVFPGTSE